MTLPYIDLKPSQLILGLSPGMEISFYSSDSMCTPLFLLSMWIIWQLVKPTAVHFPGRERDSILCLQPTGMHADYGLAFTTVTMGDQHALLKLSERPSTFNFSNPLSYFYLIPDYFFLLLKSYKQLHWSMNTACNKLKWRRQLFCKLL